MKDILLNLYSLYKPNKYNFHNSKNINFFSREFDKHVIDISYVKYENEFYIFLFISEDKLKFKGILKKSNNNLDKEFDSIVENLTNSTMDQFIENYSKIVIENINL